jgi:uncharacterized protein YbcI
VAETTDADQRTFQDRGLAIANAITKLHRQHYGRGAASARTIMGKDHVVVFLEDIYTTVERTLIEAGHFEQVRATRHTFQQTMRRDFCNAVEEITGRTVIGFMSEVHMDPDVSAEIFVLAKRNQEAF